MNIMKKNRGQVLVLGALTCLVLVVTLMMTFSISWQVRNRIQLQHAADAQAFADATLTARIFNSFAYTNRAIAANIVSMTILHAFHSEVSAAADLHWAIQEMYAQALAYEGGKCSGCGIWCPSCCIHCFHMIEPGLKMVLNGTLPWITGDMGNLIGRTERAFQDAIGSIDESIRMAKTRDKSSLLSLQKTMKDALKRSMWGNFVDAVTGNLGSVGQMNEVNMVNGQGHRNSEIIGSLMGEDKFEKMFETSQNKRATSLSDVVNSSRPVWVRNRINLEVTNTLLFPLVFDLMDDLTGGDFRGGLIHSNAGSAALFKNFPVLGTAAPLVLGVTGDPKTNSHPTEVASYDSWRLTGVMKSVCNAMVSSNLPALNITLTTFFSLFPAYVVSNSNGGEHSGGGLMGLIGFPNNVHSSNHRIGLEDYFDLVVYNSLAHEEKDYAQPSMFSSFSVDSLSTRYDRAVNDSNYRKIFDLKFKANIGGENSIDLRNNEEARAVAKAFVYYHHPGNWKEPPNFWNPFWRAKLEAYTMTDVANNVIDFL